MHIGKRTLPTWAERSHFSYEGAVNNGTVIHYGTDYRYSAQVNQDQYRKLLAHFAGKTVSIGTSRDIAPAGSLGKWLQENVTPTALASYVGSILVYEGYAERKIRFGFCKSQRKDS